MNVSIGWISALLGRAVDPDDAAARLTMLGAPVESVERIHHDLEGVVIALVESVERHPDADRLTVCRVHDGTVTRDVVCGATNVVAGRKYPYAPVDTVLPGGFKLEARKIRGVLSNGMLCSPRELGLGEDHEGIMELETDAAPGTPFLEALPVADVRLEVEVTANRPDLLCHKGVARELAAVYAVPVKLPPIPNAPDDIAAPRRVTKKGTVGGIEVVIDDVDGCPRYMAAVVRGVRIGPSPDWLQARLRSVGARPINNVVDATNYVLHELNQPMHAFDLKLLGGAKIVVRRAVAGERVVTLDGEARDLTADMTMICDAKRVSAVAGVMGGAESEVTERTTDVLLECAYFDPKRIRTTRQALKMSTEASYRFERGIDIEGMPDALRRAIALIRAVAGGQEPEPALDVYPKPRKQKSVFVRPSRVAHLLGVPLSRDEIEASLVRLGFPVAPKDDRLHVQIPGWRPDVTREVDLIEEVARLRGYDSFPSESRPLRPSVVPTDPNVARQARLERAFTGLGLYQARSLSLTGSGGSDAFRVQNPLSAEDAYLRRDLLSGLTRSVERNWAVRERDVRLFEIGTVFRDTGGPLPEETTRVAAVVTGARVPAHWTGSGKAPDFDRWDIKALFETAVRSICPEGTIESTADGWKFTETDGTVRGWAGALEADRPAWAAVLFGFELETGDAAPPATTFVPLPTTPPVERDLALVLPPGVTAAAVEGVIRDAAGALLAELAVFDEYRGSEMAGRSVAWRLVFRAPDRTLRDTEADTALAKVLASLKERLGVERREA